MKTFDGIAYVIKKVEETEHKSRLNPPISSYIRLCSNISMLMLKVAFAGPYFFVNSF